MDDFYCFQPSLNIFLAHAPIGPAHLLKPSSKHALIGPRQIGMAFASVYHAALASGNIFLFSAHLFSLIHITKTFTLYAH